MSSSKQARERRFQLVGWGLFLVCSLFFIADSVASEGPWGLVGSILFLLGCIIFLIPFFWKEE